jgi:hypothetical protein
MALPTSLDWLNIYHPLCYSALQAQYDYTIGLGVNVSEWQLEFNQLFSALNNWQSHNIRGSVEQLINSAYSYILVGYQFGYISVFSIFTPRYIFSCNDFLNTIASRPVTWYDDLLYNGMTFLYNSAKIDADLATIAGYATLENQRVADAVNAAASLTASHLNKVLYDIPQPQPIHAVGRDDVRDIVFINLGYKVTYQSLNVGGLTLPLGLP